MANILPTDKKTQVIAALAERSAIRSNESMTGIHRDTIMRLGVKVRQGCTPTMAAGVTSRFCTVDDLVEATA